MNGRLVPWADSTIHISTEAVLRGGAVFEGIRVYRSRDDELVLFRLDDHMRRLYQTSLRFLQMPLAYKPAELAQGIAALLEADGVASDAHIRVVVYYEELTPGRERETETGAFIIVREGLAMSDGATRASLSPWRRMSDVATPPRVKASANYLNSRVAITDAQRKGFDTAIMLNDRGKVSEGPTMNLFLVRDGSLITPRVTDGILEGITRATVIDLADQLGIPLAEREIDPSELFIADEVFFCGTAYEVEPVIEIDGYVVGDGEAGPITTRIRDSYFAIARGETSAPTGWITPVRDLMVAR
nr:branched-chain-amino-acid transaminase [Kribbella shirazensis]